MNDKEKDIDDESNNVDIIKKDSSSMNNIVNKISANISSLSDLKNTLKDVNLNDEKLDQIINDLTQYKDSIKKEVDET